MDRFSMERIIKLLALSFLFVCVALAEEKAAPQPVKVEPKKAIVANIKIPYVRPIGFTINLASIASMTFEGRFLLGLLPNFSLVVSPSYQNTPEIPFYHPQRDQWSVFDIKRLNLGAGIRGHFYEYDSLDGWFLEGMGRLGMTWIGSDSLMGSVIPSLILGYSTVYDSGYSVSFGFGFEWEFLFGGTPGYHTDFLKTAYYGITKLPLTGEFSIGWTW